MDFNSFKTDPELEEKGVWVPVGEGSKMLIASTGSSKYREYANKRLRPYQHLIAKNAFPEKEAETVMVDILAHCVLLNWDGFTEGEENGEPKQVPYSIETAKRVLKENRKFRELVQSLADDAETFRGELFEAEAKNSVSA